MSSNTTTCASDGLLARLIKPHTLEKFDYHDRYCDIVSVGMPASWGGLSAMPLPAISSR